ncbi:hypothetical protein AX16_003581 [Volvariella volvacea WC 439]|nr:hypothetical protein AX16_003581 [Volvariella volvacea WC 439]
MAKGGDFAELMDLMFTKPRVDELRSIAEGSGQERPSTENLWYISDKAEITIRLGALRMDLTKDHLNQFPDQQAYKISLTGVIDCPLLTTNEGKSLAADKDPHYATFPKNSTVKPPSPALIDFLKRIASLTHAIGVEEKRRRGGYYTWFDGLIQAPVGLYRWIFRIIPNSLRRHVYAILFRAGIYLYGAPGLLSGPVQRVPFGLYIKHGSPQRLLSEEAALKLIEQETNIPAPRHIDTYISTEGKIYMIMTRIPGQQLKSVLFSLSTEELKTLRQDLVRLIAQLRRVRNKSFPLICNVLGEGIKYHWDSDTRSGPFNAEADFDNFMLHKLSETRRQKLGTIISNNVVLTHGDLHSANIIMLNGRLSGVVDWELTGWMPAYWEYLKMERLSLHQAEEILLRPEKVFERFGEDWTSLVWRQDEIWSSLR